MTQNLQPEASVSSFSLTVSPCLPSSRSSSLVCVLSARAPRRARHSEVGFGHGGASVSKGDSILGKMQLHGCLSFFGVGKAGEGGKEPIPSIIRWSFFKVTQKQQLREGSGNMSTWDLVTTERSWRLGRRRGFLPD